MLVPPTNMEARKDMAFRPVEDALEFLPVGDVFEVKVLYWGAGYDESVIIAVLNLIKLIVEFLQV